MNAADGRGPLLLEARGVHVRYGRVDAVRGASIDVGAGEIVALIGPNGAGKTTLLRALLGVVGCRAECLRLSGDDLRRAPTHRRARRGLVLVPEGRGLFAELSVEDNLRMPQVARRVRSRGMVGEVLDAFPILEERLRQRAGSLSGGEQQMLAIARALLSAPRVLLLDEVSLGLHPTVVEAVYAALRQVLGRGELAALVVEQHVDRALALADRASVMVRGSIVACGPSSELRENVEQLRSLYLGGAAVAPPLDERPAPAGSGGIAW